MTITVLRIFVQVFQDRSERAIITVLILALLACQAAAGLYFAAQHWLLAH